MAVGVTEISAAVPSLHAAQHELLSQHMLTGVHS